MSDLWRGYTENEQLEFRRSFDGVVLVIQPHEKVQDAWVCVLPDGTRIIGELAGGDGRHARLLRKLGRADLLILDDCGLNVLDAEARQDLLEILEERYGCRSTIVTSQLPVDGWHDVIGDPTYADAILDRLVHNAHRIDLTGESLRKKRSKGVKDS
jgi:DNA replication protein DnaC